MDSKTLVTAPPKEAEIGPLAKTVGGKGGPGGSEACHLLPTKRGSVITTKALKVLQHV